MGLQHENGDAPVRKALDEAFARQNGNCNGGPAQEESENFCPNPAEYEWSCAGKRNMLIPYKIILKRRHRTSGLAQTGITHSGSIRLEMHNVWVVEGSLRRGESNLLAMRRFYIDEQSWLVVAGEGYDSAGKLTSYYMLYKRMPADSSQRGRWVSGFPAA